MLLGGFSLAGGTGAWYEPSGYRWVTLAASLPVGTTPLIYSGAENLDPERLQLLSQQQYLSAWWLSACAQPDGTTAGG